VEGPGHRRALFAAVTAVTVLAVLALGSLPSPTPVERTAVVAGARDRPDRRAPPTTTTTATTEVPVPAFGPGLHEVGPTGIRPGRYVTLSDLCSWERRSAAGEVLAADTGSGQVLVEVDAGDASFSSAPGCGRWRAFDEDHAAPLPSLGPGTFAVGSQLAPGRWRSDGCDLCYWERLSGLGGGLDELVASAGVSGPTEVEVAPTDVAFSSLGCGTWRPAR
jgi:hypothetical protein